MSIGEVGLLTLTQYQALLNEQYKLEKERCKQQLILLRASKSESETFSNILESFGD